MAVLRDSTWGSDGGSDYTLAILSSSDVGRHVLRARAAVSNLQPGKRMNQVRTLDFINGSPAAPLGVSEKTRLAHSVFIFLIAKQISRVVLVMLAVVLALISAGCATQSVASALDSTKSGAGRYQYSLLDRITSWEYQLKLKADQYDMHNITKLRDAVFERLKSYAEANTNSFSIHGKTREEKYDYRLWSVVGFGNESAVLIKVRDWISSPNRGGTSDMSLKYQGVDNPKHFKFLSPSESVVAKLENDVKCVKSKFAYTAMKAPLGIDSKSVVLNQVSDIDKHFGNANVGAWLNMEPNSAIREVRQKRVFTTGRACKLGSERDAVKCRVAFSANIVDGDMQAEFSLRIKRDNSAANWNLGLQRARALFLSLNQSSFALEACP